MGLGSFGGGDIAKSLGTGGTVREQRAVADGCCGGEDAGAAGMADGNSVRTH
jgi:hypothetical protein